MKHNHKYDEIIDLANEYEIYFRAQSKNISLDNMQNWKSFHGYDMDGNEIYLNGVAASDLLGEKNFGGASYAAEEIVVLKGDEVDVIYDGVVVYPTEIVYRFSRDEYFNNFLRYLDEYV